MSPWAGRHWLAGTVPSERSLPAAWVCLRQERGAAWGPSVHCSLKRSSAGGMGGAGAGGVLAHWAGTGWQHPWRDVL